MAWALLQNAWFPALTATLLLFIWRRHRQQQQTEALAAYRFHPAIRKRVQRQYPHLGEQDLLLVEQALRDFFRMNQLAGRRQVAMPSQVVDVAWHEFILFTRLYQQFCQHSFGRFLHHTPTEVMASPTHAQQSIRHAWRLACALTRQSPSRPLVIPLIFAIDEQLKIADGFQYRPNCSDNIDGSIGSYCTTHINCSSGCSGESWTGSGDSSSDSGSSGCSGGD